jgi:predicted O-methyltransferase YrrM
MEIQTSIEQAKSLFTWPDSKPNIIPETNGWFTHASANVLSMFIQHLNPRFIAELGSWTGTGSTRFLLDAAPNSHLLCFDHWSPNVNDHGNSGTTVYADDDPELLQLPKIWDSFLYNNWEHRNHLTPIRAKTPIGLESVKQYNFPVDLIFIDADHSYQGAYNDIMKCAELWPNAQITGDDYTWETVKAAVIDAAKALDKRVIFCHNCWWLTDEIAFEINF